MIRLLLLSLVLGATTIRAEAQTASRASDPRRSVPAGKVDTRVIFDSSYRRPRRVWVYTPPGYDAKAPTPYPLLVAFDGDEYRDTMPLPMVLDTQVKAAPHKPVRFALDVGALEDHPTLGGSEPNFLDANRRFRDVLRMKGYDVAYTEVPGGNHAPQWWQARLPDGIVLLSAPWLQR